MLLREETERPIELGDVRIVPVTRSLRLGLPRRAALVWRGPARVVVTEAAGQERSLPVKDVTRRWQLALLGLGILGALGIRRRR